MKRLHVRITNIWAKRLGLTLVFFAVLGWFYWVQLSPPNQWSVRELIHEVEKIRPLPHGELPLLATVTNESKLGRFALFQKAAAGDQVLLYPKAGLALLYRPSMKIIVSEMTGDVVKQLTQGQLNAMTENDVPMNLSLIIYNGTNDTHQADAIELSVVAQFPKLKMDGKQTAARSDYRGIQVFDLSQKNPSLVRDIAVAIGGHIVKEWPVGETRPASDILVLVGQKDGQ